MTNERAGIRWVRWVTLTVNNVAINGINEEMIKAPFLS